MSNPKAMINFPDKTSHFYIIWSFVCCVLSHSVMSDSCDPIDCNLPGSSVHGIL